MWRRGHDNRQSQIRSKIAAEHPRRLLLAFAQVCFLYIPFTISLIFYFMTPFTLLSIFTLVLVPGGQRLVHFRDVVALCHNCRNDFGWPGHTFPNDPWGPVMTPKAVASGLVAADPSASTVAKAVASSPHSGSGLVLCVLIPTRPKKKTFTLIC